MNFLRRIKAICDPARPDAFLAGGVARAGGEAFLWGRRTPDDAPRALPETLRLRCASITKMATARVACALAAEGRIDLDAPAALPIGGPPSLAQLLSHTSGLTDRAGYIVEPPASPIEHLADGLDTIRTHSPGAYFRYANLNYVLAGLLIERVTGERLDLLMRRHVLDPARISGGPNWVGVSDRARLPMLQRRGARYEPEIDGTDGDWDADLIWRDGRGVSLETYRIGEDTMLLSPHAGLRASLPELARLAALLLDGSEATRLMTAPRWSAEMPGDGAGGLFPAFGLGCTILTVPGLPRLIGHAGHALGFTGGAWANPGTGAAYAYGLTGSADLTEGQDGESFFPEEELAILRGF